MHSRLGVIASIFAVLVPYSANSASLGDSSFFEEDWTQFFIIDTTPGGAGGSGTIQAAAGGNPGTYQFGVHSFGPGRLWIAHEFLGEPAVGLSTGGIANLKFSFDFQVISARFSDSRSVSIAPLVVQSGQYYVPTLQSNIAALSSGSGWQSFSFDLAQGDFSLIDGGPTTAGNPDFSASGDPFRVGYVSLNNTSIANNRKSWGIDNFEASFTQEITPNPVPLPATVWLMVSGLFALGAVRRRKT